MQNQTVNSVKLGLFVLTGLSLLIFALYLLGKNRSLFSSDFVLKTRFRTVNGLVTGNNVRYNGIEVGSVGNVLLVNDTVIEVTLHLEKKMKNIIRTNAVASLGTDGLIGNRVVNIAPGKGNAPFVQGGTLLASQEEIDTDKMLQTLRRTNENVAQITVELLATVHRINNSAQLAELLDDRSISQNLKASLVNLRQTTSKASALMTNAAQTLALASKGEGALATLLTDTSLAIDLRHAVQQIQTVENSAVTLAGNLDSVARSLDRDLNTGKGPAQALLKDSLMADQLRQTLDNVEKGTEKFDQNMEALKHNFLFRRYFKKQEKAKKKAQEAAQKKQ